MTQDADSGNTPGAPGRRARRVATSRAERGPRVAGKRKAPQPGKTVAKVILASLMALAMATGAGVVLMYNNWNGNLDVQSLNAQLKNRPKKKQTGPQEPMNILVMGSDTRDGVGNKVDGESGGGVSDTTIMFHLSANREFAYGISIPRDTLVDRPECYKENGQAIPAKEDAIWNEAFAVGGPACTVQQFEQLSGILIDKYVVVDFNGFKDMVNALDGVEVCIPEDINDEEHGITLEAGTREIRDQEALSYVRVRHVGDGTDPQRIKRQQAFMAGMINKAVSAGMLARPDRLVGFMNAVTDSLKTDFENIAELADIAGTFQGIGLDHIKFVTTPWDYSTEQVGRVVWQPEVEDLWQLVIDDQRLSRQFLGDAISAGDRADGSPSSSGSASTDGTSDPTTDPSDDPTGDPTEESTGPEGDATDRPDLGMSDEDREAAGLCA